MFVRVYFSLFLNPGQFLSLQTHCILFLQFDYSPVLQPRFLQLSQLDHPLILNPNVSSLFHLLALNFFYLIVFCFFKPAVSISSTWPSPISSARSSPASISCYPNPPLFRAFNSISPRFINLSFATCQSYRRSVV